MQNATSYKFLHKWSLLIVHLSLVILKNLNLQMDNLLAQKEVMIDSKIQIQPNQMIISQRRECASSTLVMGIARIILILLKI